MFAVTLTICEIFAKLISYQKFNIENEGQGGEKLDLYHLARNVRFHIGEFFRIVVTWKYTFMQKVIHLTHTHTHSHTHSKKQGNDYRRNLQSRFT